MPLALGSNESIVAIACVLMQTRQAIATEFIRQNTQSHFILVDNWGATLLIDK